MPSVTEFIKKYQDIFLRFNIESSLPELGAVKIQLGEQSISFFDIKTIMLLRIVGILSCDPQSGSCVTDNGDNVISILNQLQQKTVKDNLFEFMRECDDTNQLIKQNIQEYICEEAALAAFERHTKKYPLVDTVAAIRLHINSLRGQPVAVSPEILTDIEFLETVMQGVEETAQCLLSQWVSCQVKLFKKHEAFDGCWPKEVTLRNPALSITQRVAIMFLYKLVDSPLCLLWVATKRAALAYIDETLPEALDRARIRAYVDLYNQYALDSFSLAPDPALPPDEVAVIRRILSDEAVLAVSPVTESDINLRKKSLKIASNAKFFNFMIDGLRVLIKGMILLRTQQGGIIARMAAVQESRELPKIFERYHRIYGARFTADDLSVKDNSHLGVLPLKLLNQPVVVFDMKTFVLSHLTQKLGDALRADSMRLAKFYFRLINKVDAASLLEMQKLFSLPRGHFVHDLPLDDRFEQGIKEFDQYLDWGDISVGFLKYYNLAQSRLTVNGFDFLSEYAAALEALFCVVKKLKNVCNYTPHDLGGNFLTELQQHSDLLTHLNLAWMNDSAAFPHSEVVKIGFMKKLIQAAETILDEIGFIRELQGNMRLCEILIERSLSDKERQDWEGVYSSANVKVIERGQNLYAASERSDLFNVSKIFNKRFDPDLTLSQLNWQRSFARIKLTDADSIMLFSIKHILQVAVSNSAAAYLKSAGDTGSVRRSPRYEAYSQLMKIIDGSGVECIVRDLRGGKYDLPEDELRGIRSFLSDDSLCRVYQPVDSHAPSLVDYIVTAMSHNFQALHEVAREIMKKVMQGAQWSEIMIYATCCGAEILLDDAITEGLQCLIAEYNVLEQQQHLVLVNEKRQEILNIVNREQQGGTSRLISSVVSVTSDELAVIREEKVSTLARSLFDRNNALVHDKVRLGGLRREAEASFYLCTSVSKQLSQHRKNLIATLSDCQNADALLADVVPSDQVSPKPSTVQKFGDTTIILDVKSMAALWVRRSARALLDNGEMTDKLARLYCGLLQFLKGPLEDIICRSISCACPNYELRVKLAEILNDDFVITLVVDARANAPFLNDEVYLSLVPAAAAAVADMVSYYQKVCADRKTQYQNFLDVENKLARCSDEGSPKKSTLNLMNPALCDNIKTDYLPSCYLDLLKIIVQNAARVCFEEIREINLDDPRQFRQFEKLKGHIPAYRQLLVDIEEQELKYQKQHGSADIQELARRCYELPPVAMHNIQQLLSDAFILDYAQNSPADNNIVEKILKRQAPEMTIASARRKYNDSPGVHAKWVATWMQPIRVAMSELNKAIESKKYQAAVAAVESLEQSDALDDSVRADLLELKQCLDDLLRIQEYKQKENITENDFDFNSPEIERLVRDVMVEFNQMVDNNSILDTYSAVQERLRSTGVTAVPQVIDVSGPLGAESERYDDSESVIEFAKGVSMRPYLPSSGVGGSASFMPLPRVDPVGKEDDQDFALLRDTFEEQEKRIAALRR